jgi:hypothetical protein
VPVVFRSPSALARALFTVIAVTAVLVTPPALAQPLWPGGPDEAKAPITAEEFNARGRSFLEKGDDDHAAADFDKATELKPGYAAAFLATTAN